ncbi:MAG: alkaline phosphatase family protein, partial [Gemmataceae bacterium]|nr:alkaline phosphatase family protein [Gemmataceae bacterium]
MRSRKRPTGRICLFLFVTVLTHVSAAPVTHIVHVSLDGLGSSYLQNYLTYGPSRIPNFVRLVTQGSYTFNARCDYFASETIPNHASIFMGRPVLQPAGLPNTIHHGCSLNAPGPTDTFHAS